MYIESQEWLFLEAIEDAVDKVTEDNEDDTPPTKQSPEKQSPAR